MNARRILMIALLAGLTGVLGGCHYGDDDHDHANGYGSYRDGYRDGRGYERRRDDWRNRRYDDWRDYYRRR